VAARAVKALPLGHPLLSMSHACLALSLWLAGRRTEALASMAALLANPLTVTLHDAAQLAVRGQLRMSGDDLPSSRADSTRALQLGLKNGVPLFALTAAAYLAEAEYRLGEWGNAVVHGDLAVSLVEDTDQLWFRALLTALPHWSGRPAVAGTWPSRAWPQP
jgi:hypothetical protein